MVIYILHELTKFLKRHLTNILQANEINNVFSSFDQIGEIVIIRIPDELSNRKKIIGEVLLDKIKKAKSIYRQSSVVKGDFRIRELELLAGIDTTETEYKEYGCRFNVDVRQVFFSPRLSTERNRISNLVKDGENIINMFGGIGMFSILIAKKKKCNIYNMDINPDAIRLCKKNLELNKIKGNVIPMCGDASNLINELDETADRTLMLLPERTDNFLDSAVLGTKNNGIIHYYCHIHADKKNALERATKHYFNIIKIKSTVLHSNIVRAIGPKYYQIAIDANIRK